MFSQQMMELLLREIRTSQEEMVAKLDADSKSWREELAAERRAIEARMEAIKARMKAMQENRGTSHKKMAADTKPKRDMETIACQECQEMEAHLEEEKLTSVDGKPETAEEEEEIPVDDAVVKPVKGWKKRHKGKKQAAGQLGEPKKLTRGICGSWMELTNTDRKVSHHAAVALRRRDAFKKETTQGTFGCWRKELTVDNCLHRLCKQSYDESQPLRGAHSSIEKPAVGTLVPRSRTSKWREDQEERRCQQVQTTLQVLLR
ncbi:hypothetical protein B7P43_G15637 [Cryptotermes secundus]|uniref:Uncharacterized protein n=1 Tax=Cryptotermes secundus TaxID=105785 RepID=A0A2J7QWZ8_9NEOP|nr:hypothetical protein B7P43_G15637 [Cryptotermes secundus]